MTKFQIIYIENLTNIVNMTRQETIVRTSIIGIVVNLILVAFKAAVGILTNSIAITLDAVNNLTDALSSIITIIGAKISGKAPDKEHPYGYGRIEYFSSVIIVAIVLWAGFTALMASWPKPFNPDVTNYTPVSLFIIAVAVAVKFILGRYVKGVGESINSQPLVASGSDAYFDSILSLSTLIAAIISLFFHISLEGILGVIISIVILKAGYDMLRETVDTIIGARAEREVSQQIKNSICEVPGVYGAYDLFIHNYGPEHLQASVHVEVDDTLTAVDIQKLTTQLQRKIYDEFSIPLVAVGVYARNDKYKDIRNDLDEIVEKYDEIIEIHGFIVYEEEKIVSFDIIVDFDADRNAVKEKVLDEIKSKHPEFDYMMIDDYDVSD